MKFALILISSLFVQLAQAADRTVVVVETTLGNFEMELNDDKAPISVANFLTYVDSGFYNDTIIHRVVPNFVVQGGGHLKDMTEKPTNAPIISEATNGLSNVKASIGMARTDDINSATSQFYINTKDNLGLDHKPNVPNKYGYAVFGKVITGYEVVEAIEKVATQTVGEYEGVPVVPIVVTSVHRKSLR